MKRCSRMLVVFALAILVFGVLSAGSIAAAKTVKVKITTKAQTIMVGDKVTITSNITPNSVRKSAKWSTSKKSVGSIAVKDKSKGTATLTAIATGKTNISVKVGKKKSNAIKITVVKRVFKVKSSGIVSGKFLDKYGSNGSQFKKIMYDIKLPTRSVPFKIDGAPAGTKCYAMILDDKASEANGWVHWTVANLKRRVVKENESLGATDFLQGTNDWTPLVAPVGTFFKYGGMAPPTGTHKYVIKVYALDAELSLKNGFTVSQLKEKMNGHILAEASVAGTYKTK